MGVEGIPFISNNIDELKVLHKYCGRVREGGAQEQSDHSLHGAVATQYLHSR